MLHTQYRPEGELDAGATIRNFRIVRREGDRDVTREIEHYNLDAIIAVGYRVKSPRGTGRMVAVVRDLGSIPRTTGLDDYQAAKAAQEYREVRDKLIQERDKYSARKRNGEWLSAGEYDRWSQLCAAINSAAKNRTHAARMRKLRAAVA